jgi:hypothetical protein
LKQQLALDRILIGDNPFIGVNHLSQERSRAKSSELNTERIARIIQVALESGATGLAFSTHPNMHQVLRYLKEQGYDREFGLYPVIPDATSYVRTASEKGVLGLLTDLFGKMDFAARARSLISGGVSGLTLSPMRMFRTYLKAEVSILKNVSPKGARLKAIFLHELITDLIVSLELNDLFTMYVKFVRDSLKVFPGFVTRNFARFVDFVSQTGLRMSDIVVLTPFNKMGFQMNPSQEACERSLLRIGNSNIIVMSIMASGHLNLEEATTYLRELPKKLSCVVGVSTESHARETFAYLREKL